MAGSEFPPAGLYASAGSIAFVLFMYAAAQDGPSWFELAWPWVTFVAGALVGAIAGHWYSVWARRPKLRLTQNGSGSDAGGWRNEVTIALAPSRLGGRVRETVLFGKEVIRPFQFGLSTTREPARNCVAWLQAVDDKRHVTGLRFMDARGLIKESPIDVNPGESVRLALFGSPSDVHARSDSYFIMSGWRESENPKGNVPAYGGLAQSESRQYRLVVRHDYGPTLKRKVHIFRTLEGTWQMDVSLR